MWRPWIIGMMGVALAAGTPVAWGQPARVGKPDATDALFDRIFALQEKRRFALQEKIRAGAGQAEAQPGTLADEAGDGFEPEDGPRGPVARINVAFEDGRFYQPVFGIAMTDAQAVARLKTSCSLAIDVLDGTYRLTEAEKEKLRLAGFGDIKRITDRIKMLRGPFGDSGHAALDKDQYRGFCRESSSIQIALTTCSSGPDSLFSKVLNKILADRGSSRAARE